MAEILITQWLWEASLVPLEDHAQTATAQTIDAWSRLVRDVPALAGLSITTGDDVGALVHAANRHDTHNLEAELQDELVAYRYEPGTVQAATLADHLRTVATPMVGGIARQRWFGAKVTHVQVTYSLTVAPSVRHPGGVKGLLASALAPDFEARTAQLMKAFGGVAASHPKEVGVKLACSAKLPRARDVDLAIELFGTDADVIVANLLLVSQDEKTPRTPWLSNAGALHQKVWPAVERFFSALEAYGSNEKDIKSRSRRATRSASSRSASRSTTSRR